jgi:aspartate/tyrosine/aromatic aminotransferase
MQNAMNELQQMMQRIGRMQQEVVAEIQAEKKGERRLMGPR